MTGGGGKRRPLLLDIVYRPLKVTKWGSLAVDFERLLPLSFSAIIIGDFNIDFNTQSFDAVSLRDFCDSNHLL